MSTPLHKSNAVLSTHIDKGGVNMQQLSMTDIYREGEIFEDTDDYVIYLMPSFPLKYYCNTWIYKRTPTIAQWLSDMARQQQLHDAQQSHHLSFYFPENELLDEQWMTLFKNKGFQLGVMELYAIESETLQQLPVNNNVEIKVVDQTTLEDYLQIHYHFAQPFGEAFAEESCQSVRQQFADDHITRLVAYLNDLPVASVDFIENESTIEIDSFGVLDDYQRQGIGSTIQAFIGEYATKHGNKTIILVADGEDTAKDMYLKQGYVFLSFAYHVLKTDVTQNERTEE